MMGADLYIRSNYDRLQQLHQRQFDLAVAKRDKAKTALQLDQAQREVNELYAAMHPDCAYYRDGYNRFSLLAQLGLSWWLDVAVRLEVDDTLGLDSVKWLHDQVRTRRITCQVKPTEEQAIAAEIVGELEGSHSTIRSAETLTAYSADDVEWFVSRKQALITFLQTALDLGEPPVCSL
jgi:hypothetical protein